MITAPLLIVLASAAVAQDVPPRPERWVTDLSGRLSPPTVQALDTRLEAFDQLTGHQVLLWIGPSGGADPETFATRAFDAWKPGREGVDDGLVLFLFPEERRSRIEVGYGLEPVVPDAYAGQVLTDVIAPRLQQGDWDGATSAGIDALLVRIDPAAAEQAGAAEPAPMAAPEDDGIPPTLVVFVLVLLFVFGRMRFGPFVPGLFTSGRSFGSGGTRGGGGSRGGGGGGGFRGGGGRSGGGGASGSW